MALAILGSFFWPIVGFLAGLVMVIFAFLHFAIAMDSVDKNPRACKKHGKWAFGLVGLSALWTVLWLFMTVMSIINWVAAATS